MWFGDTICAPDSDKLSSTHWTAITPTCKDLARLLQCAAASLSNLSTTFNRFSPTLGEAIPYAVKRCQAWLANQSNQWNVPSPGRKTGKSTLCHHSMRGFSQGRASGCLFCSPSNHFQLTSLVYIIPPQSTNHYSSRHCTNIIQYP